jgi:hypothetical protein
MTTWIPYERYRSTGWTEAKTDAKHFEARMFHPSQKGLLRGVHAPFYVTDSPQQGHVNHEVSITLRRPMHIFTPILPSHVDAAGEMGYDGIVSHTPEGMQAMIMDPGAVVPGHEHGFPYGG